MAKLQSVAEQAHLAHEAGLVCHQWLVIGYR
jgi:hypothetical protein